MIIIKCDSIRVHFEMISLTGQLKSPEGYSSYTDGQAKLFSISFACLFSSPHIEWASNTENDDRSD